MISKMLTNPFYCGTIEYRKSYIPDYLEQKAVKNTGQVEKVIVEGRHEPIISKEDFDKVQELLKKHKYTYNIEKERGKGTPKNVWTKKLICKCGSSFNKRVNHKYDDYTSYMYVCYNVKNNGSLKKRHAKGLDTTNSCDNKGVQDWKLYLMSKFVFDMICKNKKKIIKYANELIDETVTKISSCENHEEEINNYDVRIRTNEEKLDNILDLLINKLISKEDYIKKKEEYENNIIEYKSKISKLREDYGITEEALANKLKNLKEIMNNTLYKSGEKIIDEMIDLYIDYIKVYDDRFEWKIKCFDDSDSYENQLLTRMIITKDDLDKFIKEYPEFRKPRMDKDIIVDVYL